MQVLHAVALILHIGEVYETTPLRVVINTGLTTDRAAPERAFVGSSAELGRKPMYTMYTSSTRLRTACSWWHQLKVRSNDDYRTLKHRSIIN